MMIPLAEILLHFNVWASLEKGRDIVDGRNAVVRTVQPEIRCSWQRLSWTTYSQAEITMLQLKNTQYCKQSLIFAVFSKLSAFQWEKNRSCMCCNVSSVFSMRFLVLNRVNFTCNFFFLLWWFSKQCHKSQVKWTKSVSVVLNSALMYIFFSALDYVVFFLQQGRSTSIPLPPTHTYSILVYTLHFWHDSNGSTNCKMCMLEEPERSSLRKGGFSNNWTVGNDCLLTFIFTSKVVVVILYTAVEQLFI